MPKYLYTAIACLFCALTTAHAQSDSLRQIIPNYDLNTIEPLIQSMGYQTERMALKNGTQVLSAKKGSSSIFFEPRACDAPAGCVGLNFVALVTDSSTMSDINNYNSRAYYTKATQIDSGSLILSRYLIGDYGTVSGSFAVNVAVFDRSIGEWFQLNNNSLSNQVSFSGLDGSPAVSEDEKINPLQFISLAEEDATLWNGQPSMDEIGQAHEKIENPFLSK